MRFAEKCGDFAEKSGMNTYTLDTMWISEMDIELDIPRISLGYVGRILLEIFGYIVDK